jgi:glycosyltransferase involved in cell wall biosynthesis
MDRPKVTVLMPVYNGEKYIGKAIDSILCQTFSNFEFLIINDGSTDQSANIVNSYNDSRIILIHNERNIRLISTLNKGLKIARGQYIARMDCDDISLPERLMRQYDFMEKNLDVGIVGSWMQIVDENEIPIRLVRYTAPPEQIPSILLFDNYFSHPSVFIRRSCLPSEGYRLFFDYAEDYDLWVRVAENSKLCNLQQVLIKYREHSSNTSQANTKIVENTVHKIMSYQLKNIGIYPTEKDLELHYRIGQLKVKFSYLFLEDVESWLFKIYSSNKIVQYYDDVSLKKIIAERWLHICSLVCRLDMKSWEIFEQSSLSNLLEFSYRDKAKFLAKCTLNSFKNCSLT